MSSHSSRPTPPYVARAITSHDAGENALSEALGGTRPIRVVV